MSDKSTKIENFDCKCNETPNDCTLCTGETADNMFFRQGPPGYPGKCLLDELTYDQVYFILQRVPQAKSHLERITRDPKLLELARTTPLIMSDIEADDISRRRLDANSLPYYTLLKGNLGGGF